MRVAICQINPTVGDFSGNLAKALDALARAERASADVVVMGELALVGYPPEDLLLRGDFVADSRAALQEFAAQTSACTAIIGFVDGEVSPRNTANVPQEAKGQQAGYATGVWNAVAVCAQGQHKATYHKRHLPNYDVFDELRYFQAGSEKQVNLVDIGGVSVGISVCEDAWIADGPISQLASAGAQMVVNINGSPFRVGKQEVREEVMAARVAEAQVPIVYVNLVGGQDELIFDGGSFVVSPTANGPQITTRCESFVELVEVVDVEVRESPNSAGKARIVEPLAELAQLWRALALGTRDYVTKSGFEKVCVGLSGGVDSSLTAAIAVDALGADNVTGVMMPSRYSTPHSVSDAEALAKNLGIETRTIEIEAAHSALAAMLGEHSESEEEELGDLTDQNLQARIRGVLLMALANEHGWLVLTTGNKSESAVGFATLYGDTAGAFAVIKDVWKQTVYELCEWRNGQGGEVIPESVLRKPPSAELKPNQLDAHSLPPYSTLDPILQAYCEQALSPEEIVEQGLGDRGLVEWVCKAVDKAEFKRRQSPIGPRLSGSAFGRDRRMPIVNRYRG